MMDHIVRLDAEKHGDLSWNPNGWIAAIASRHMLQVQAAEITAAAMRCPVVFSKVTAKNEWALSAITSFVPGRNLLLSDGQWRSPFRLSEMETFPFLLVPSDDGKTPVLGVDEKSPALVRDSSNPIFASGGKLAIPVRQIETKLHDGIQSERDTRAFIALAEELGLIAPIILNVTYADGEVVRIGGLSSVNEDRLKGLSDEETIKLQRAGVLGLLYSVLFSLSQLNGLILLHNEAGHARPISKINIELSRDVQTL